jgi:hypothetical protein
LLIAEEQAAIINQAFDITHSILPKIGASPHICLALFNNVDIALLCDIVSAFVKEGTTIKPPFRVDWDFSR